MVRLLSCKEEVKADREREKKEKARKGRPCKRTGRGGCYHHRIGSLKASIRGRDIIKRDTDIQRLGPKVVPKRCCIARPSSRSPEAAKLTRSISTLLNSSHSYFLSSFFMFIQLGFSFLLLFR